MAKYSNRHASGECICKPQICVYARPFLRRSHCRTHSTSIPRSSDVSRTLASFFCISRTSGLGSLSTCVSEPSQLPTDSASHSPMTWGTVIRPLSPISKCMEIMRTSECLEDDVEGEICSSSTANSSIISGGCPICVRRVMSILISSFLTLGRRKAELSSVVSVMLFWTPSWPKVTEPFRRESSISSFGSSLVKTIMSSSFDAGRAAFVASERSIDLVALGFSLLSLLAGGVKILRMRLASNAY